MLNRVSRQAPVQAGSQLFNPVGGTQNERYFGFVQEQLARAVRELLVIDFLLLKAHGRCAQSLLNRIHLSACWTSPGRLAGEV